MATDCEHKPIVLRNIRVPDPCDSFTATVYKIVIQSEELKLKYKLHKEKTLYVGSTASDLGWRWHAHKTEARKRLEVSDCIHRFMAEEGPDHFAVEAIEILEGCRSRRQMLMMEEEWRLFLDPIYNARAASKEVSVKKPPFLPYMCTC